MTALRRSLVSALAATAALAMAAPLAAQQQIVPDGSFKGRPVGMKMGVSNQHVFQFGWDAKCSLRSLRVSSGPIAEGPFAAVGRKFGVEATITYHHTDAQGVTVKTKGKLNAHGRFRTAFKATGRASFHLADDPRVGDCDYSKRFVLKLPH